MSCWIFGGEKCAGHAKETDYLGTVGLAEGSSRSCDWLFHSSDPTTHKSLLRTTDDDSGHRSEYDEADAERMVGLAVFEVIPRVASPISMLMWLPR